MRKTMRTKSRSRFALLEGLEERALFSTYTVTNTNNSGAGSLRQAMTDANNHGGADVIAFKIGTGLKTIAPTSPLPTIKDAVTIDGTTQPGFAGKPVIEIRGDRAGTGTVYGL